MDGTSYWPGPGSFFLNFLFMFYSTNRLAFGISVFPPVYFLFDNGDLFFILEKTLKAS